MKIIKKFALLFLSFLLLSNLASAQVISSDEIYGLIAILLVIGMILIAAGFSPKTTTTFPIGLLVFIIIVIVLVIIPIVLPSFMGEKILEKEIIKENWKLAPLPSWLSKVLIYLGIPSSWFYVPAFIYLFIFPFVSVFVIIYGFLKQLKIFVTPEGEKIIRILALLFSLSILPTGFFARIVYYYFAISAFFGVGTFIAMFVLGVILLGGRKVTFGYHEMRVISDVDKALRRLEDEERHLLEEIRRAPPDRLPELRQRLDAIRDRKSVLREEKRKVIRGE